MDASSVAVGEGTRKRTHAEMAGTEELNTSTREETAESELEASTYDDSTVLESGTEQIAVTSANTEQASVTLANGIAICVDPRAEPDIKYKQRRIIQKYLGKLLHDRQPDPGDRKLFVEWKGKGLRQAFGSPPNALDPPNDYSLDIGLNYEAKSLADGGGRERAKLNMSTRKLNAWKFGFDWGDNCKEKRTTVQRPPRKKAKRPAKSKPTVCSNDNDEEDPAPKRAHIQFGHQDHQETREDAATQGQGVRGETVSEETAEEAELREAMEQYSEELQALTTEELLERKAELKKGLNTLPEAGDITNHTSKLRLVVAELKTRNAPTPGPHTGVTEGQDAGEDYQMKSEPLEASDQPLPIDESSELVVWFETHHPTLEINNSTLLELETQQVAVGSWKPFNVEVDAEATHIIRLILHRHCIAGYGQDRKAESSVDACNASVSGSHEDDCVLGLYYWRGAHHAAMILVEILQ